MWTDLTVGILEEFASRSTARDAEWRAIMRFGRSKRPRTNKRSYGEVLARARVRGRIAYRELQADPAAYAAHLAKLRERYAANRPDYVRHCVDCGAQTKPRATYCEPCRRTHRAATAARYFQRLRCSPAQTCFEGMA